MEEASGPYLCCVICLDPISRDRSMHLECNHVFHTSCMLNYISSSMKNMVQCPVCRRDVVNLAPSQRGFVAQERIPMSQVSVTVQPMFPDSEVQGPERSGCIQRTPRLVSGLGIALLFGFWVLSAYRS